MLRTPSGRRGPCPVVEAAGWFVSAMTSRLLAFTNRVAGSFKARVFFLSEISPIILTDFPLIMLTAI